MDPSRFIPVVMVAVEKYQNLMNISMVARGVHSSCLLYWLKPENVS